MRRRSMVILSKLTLGVLFALGMALLIAQQHPESDDKKEPSDGKKAEKPSDTRTQKKSKKKKGAPLEQHKESDDKK